MNEKWKNITSDNVKEAIELFENTNENYPEPRNTFLIYNGKKYPAKHIRGLAYFIANGKEISKSEYSGGQETVNFFKKLDFTVQYKKQTINKPLDKTEIPNKKTEPKKKNKVSKKLNPVDQKNALQLLFQRHFGVIETEKKFDWLKTPNHDNLPKEYFSISKGLLDYRNQNGFQKSNYQLLCDIVLEDLKLIIEYDENQHFSKARQITLENYPKNVVLNFSKSAWIESCKNINSKDNSPIDRDEKRAFYDTVRDIEAYKHGYRLIRIKHGDFDWESENAENVLKSLIDNSILNNDVSFSHHKIARLIVTGEQYDNSVAPNYEKLDSLLLDFVEKTIDKKHFEFLTTPGGYLIFELPNDLRNYPIEELETKHLDKIYKSAEIVVKEYFQNLPEQIALRLHKVADYFTVGIDGFHIDKENYLELDGHHIELVAIYDLKKKNVIRWTGKFYPTESQKRNLIKINDLDTHFIELNNQRIAILGCHDLNVYSPRGQATANPTGWKKQLADRFKKQCKKYNPEIILQHPHTTDTSNIWNLAWRTVEKELPNVKHFASGIKYFNWNGEPREILSKVLDKTKRGDVIDYE